MKCQSCRKDDAVLTWWERLRFWCFQRFHQDILDLSQEKYTMGFGDGYKKACETKTKESTVVLDQLQAIEWKLESAIRPLTPQGKLEAVKVEDVFSTVIAGGKPVLLLDGHQLTETDRDQLKAEADYFTRSRLWRIMQETVKQKAIEKSVTNSKEWEEVLTGKAMLHNLGILDSITNAILKIK